jgi:hypothetical protein
METAECLPEVSSVHCEEQNAMSAAREFRNRMEMGTRGLSQWNSS